MKCNSCKNCNWVTEYEPPIQIAVCSKGHWSEDPFTDGPDHHQWDSCKDYKPEYIESIFMGRYRGIAGVHISRRLLWHIMLSSKTFNQQTKIRHKLTLYTMMCEGMDVEWWGW